MANVIENMYNFLKVLFSGIFQDFIIAVIMILIGFIVGKIIGKLIEKILAELEIDKALKNIGDIRVKISEIVGLLLTYFIYFVAIVLALNQLKLTTAVLYWTSIGIIVLIILSFILSLRDFLPNIISGFYITSRKMLDEGDLIRIKDVEGEIRRIGLAETSVELKSGDIVYVPNALLTKTEVLKIRRRRLPH